MRVFRTKLALFAVLAVLLVAPALRAQEKADVVMKAMRDELARSTTQLHMADLEKPYFISYRIDDMDTVVVAATLGGLTQSNPSQVRLLGVELRVGDYSFDNTNYISADSFGPGGMAGGITQGPLDDDYQQVRRALWLTTDAQYKRAAEEFSAKKAALANRKRTDSVADFSKEAPASVSGKRIDTKMDAAALEQLARDVSLPFKQMPEIMSSSVRVEFKNIYTRYLNSEGSTFTRAQPSLILHIDAETQAADGLPIHESIQLFGRSLADLPSKNELVAKSRDMAARLQKLCSAGSADRYNGPVLFEDEAAAEIFAHAFAPALVASRIPDSDDPRFEIFFKQMMSQMGLGASLLDRVGGRVLPESIDLVDDPRMSDYKGTKLAGSYEIDDDAVPAHPTKLVEKGILRTLLTSRVPVRSLSHSTGSRRSLGAVPSNLLLTADKPSSNADLRAELLRRVQQRGLEYGIIVRHTGGNAASSVMRSAAMMASSPQSTPSSTLLDVYKVFPDGHEEPIKGAELSGLTASAFRDIVGVGDKPVVFNDQFIPNINSVFTMGMSGGLDLPVASFVVPSLLFEELSLTKAEGPFPAPPASKAPLAATALDLVEPETPLESVLDKMDAATAHFRSAEANFVWDQYQKVVDETDTQKGKIYFRRTGNEVQMAADIREPNPRYVLFADSKIQIYQPGIDQITAYDTGKNRGELESFLVLGFGGSGHDLLKSFDIKYLGTEKLGGLQTGKLELIPKSQKVRNNFDRFILWIEPERGVSVQQQIFEPSGNSRLAKYSDIRINQKIADGVFIIKTTGKTKVVPAS